MLLTQGKLMASAWLAGLSMQSVHSPEEAAVDSVPQLLHDQVGAHLDEGPLVLLQCRIQLSHVARAHGLPVGTWALSHSCRLPPASFSGTRMQGTGTWQQPLEHFAQQAQRKRPLSDIPSLALSHYKAPSNHLPQPELRLSLNRLKKKVADSTMAKWQSLKGTYSTSPPHACHCSVVCTYCRTGRHSARAEPRSPKAGPHLCNVLVDVQVVLLQQACRWQPHVDHVDGHQVVQDAPLVHARAVQAVLERILKVTGRIILHTHCSIVLQYL